MERILRTAAFCLIDAIIVNIAYLGAFLLRFDGVIPAEYLVNYPVFAVSVTVITISVYYIFGFYRKMWQYASIREMYYVFLGVTAASLVVIAAAYIFIYPEAVMKPMPRSIYPIAWLLNLVFTSGSRFGVRFFREYRNGNGKNGESAAAPVNPKRALIIGAGEAGAMVAKEMYGHPTSGLLPVGFIDDDLRKQGMDLFNIPVLGRREDIPHLVVEYKIDEIIIAMPSAPGQKIREIVDICKGTGVRVKTVPGVYELIDGKVSVSQLREVQLEDLLGRDPVQLDMERIAAYLKGKTVLVTGAGGSIGSELCRQVARFQPGALILLDNTENNLFDIEQELKEHFPDIKQFPELADVRKGCHIKRVFELYHPQVVFHAAAYKHVPMMERFPEHAVDNNIYGTYLVASTAKKHSCETFVFVSTDKAVNPTSVMGASKRAAELVVQHFNEQCKEENLNSRFAAVRFGNVLGSRGSVIPTFKRQISDGGPVTVTHPDMVRYFMTIPEAVQLIVQAGSFAKGGELFVLDMGEPVRILDLAEDMIRLSGLTPGKDIEIKITGMRPGEKLREELFTDQEKM
ncbi:MAG: nucleoside-diphosphate sugar epimerase/dehydratase, partial [Syntrophaceticus sp.]|nr:nucleoside-diphosphate sugar epimerase/dehydratase [Syntrophaceticus sp.]